MTMFYMGITALHHDSSVALIDEDGNIINATTEAEFTGIRGDSSWPARAIEWSLKNAKARNYNIDEDNIIYSYFENPWARFKRRIMANPLKAFQFLSEAQEPQKHIKNLVFNNHHQTHALTAVKTSPFNEGYYIIADAVGEDKSISWGEFNGNGIEEKGSVKHPNSLGILYSAFMNALSFQTNRDEWKLDAIGQTGKPNLEYIQRIYDRIITLTDNAFEFKSDISARGAINILFEDNKIPTSELPNWIASLNAVVVEVLSHICNSNFDDQTKQLVFGGGLANNTTLCSNIQSLTDFTNIWVPPLPGNGGSAIGAALASMKEVKILNYYTHFYGPEIDDCPKVSPMLLKNVVKRLEDGEVVGWIQGPAEFTSNGFGHRFLLSDPRNEETCQKMSNINGKSMPYVDTAAVLVEMIDSYFQTNNKRILYQSGMFSGRIRNFEAYSGISNQLVRVLAIPRSIDSFRALLTKWSSVTMCDMLACNNMVCYNNEQVDTIVGNRQQAMTFLLETELDSLVIGNRVYYKVEQAGLGDDEPNTIAEFDDYSIGVFNG